MVWLIKLKMVMSILQCAYCHVMVSSLENRSMSLMLESVLLLAVEKETH